MTLAKICRTLAPLSLAFTSALSLAASTSTVSGSININFKSRLPPQASDKSRPTDNLDEYKLDLRVLDHHVGGTISRQPEVEMIYTLDAKPPKSASIPLHGKISLGDKGNKMELGKLLMGVVPFSGQIFKSSIGKDKEKKSIFRFSKVHLPGISLTPASTLVEGTLTYNYKDDSFVSDLKLSASANDKMATETIRGQIKWISDKAAAPGTAASHYDFDLSLQDGVNKAGSIKGTVRFSDVKGDNDVSLKTHAEYNLTAQDVSDRQLLNFMKVWLVMVGPTHDD